MKSILLLTSIFLLHTAQAGTWANLWSTPDQQAEKALKKGDAKTAVEKFQNPQWRASAQYYAKDYQQALRGFRQNNSSTGLYNQGNALAFLKKYADAIKAYDQALAKDPKNSDTKHNRDIVKKLLQQQKQKNKQQKKNKQQQQNKQQKGNKGDKQPPSKNKSSKSDKQTKSKNDNQQQPPKSDQDKSSKQNQSKQDQQNQSKQDQSKQNQSKQDQQNKSKQNQQQQTANAKQADKQPTTEQQQSTSQHQRDRETKQWLAQIPDDPGGLLKQKFLRDHQRLQKKQDT